jgi:hypothetical protein
MAIANILVAVVGGRLESWRLLVVATHILADVSVHIARQGIGASLPMYRKHWLVDAGRFDYRNAGVGKPSQYVAGAWDSDASSLGSDSERVLLLHGKFEVFKAQIDVAVQER